MKKQLVFLSLLLVVVLSIFGCQAQQPSAATQQETAPAEIAPSPAPEAQPAPAEAAPQPETAPAPAEAPSEEVASAPADQPTSVAGNVSRRDYYKTHLAYTAPQPKEMTGVVYDLFRTSQGDLVGNIRPDGETRRYEFEVSFPLQRYDRVRFKMSTYGEISDVRLIGDSESATSVFQMGIGTREQTVSYNGSTTVILGTVKETRVAAGNPPLHKYTGTMKQLDGFREYPFSTDTALAQGQKVRLVLDGKWNTVSITKVE